MYTLYLGDDFIFILFYSTFYSILFYSITLFFHSYFLGPAPVRHVVLLLWLVPTPSALGPLVVMDPCCSLEDHFPCPEALLGGTIMAPGSSFHGSLRLACGKLSCIPGDSMGKGACSYYSQEGAILLLPGSMPFASLSSDPLGLESPPLSFQTESQLGPDFLLFLSLRWGGGIPHL